MSADLGHQMQQLYQQFGEVSGVSIELHKELLAIRVDNQQATATVFLQGAQLSHYQHRGGQPIIWCSPDCDYSAGVPLRGGIPICWPWFGNLAKNLAPVQQHINCDDAPAHGFVRQRHWQVSAIENIDNHLTQMQLQLSLAEGEESLWPTATELQLTILIGKTLTLTLEIRNTSHQTVCFSNALHSYFAIGDIEQVVVKGLEGLNYIDCMDNWNEHKQQGPLTIGREVDRIYQGAHNDITLIDKHWQRIITLHSEGSDSAVVWNPWQDKARRLSHFADDAYKKMLCIETANADKDLVPLAAGETHRLVLTISSSALS